MDGYAIDSRLVEKGDIFFALKGKKFDGHAFLKDVAERGAIAAVVEKSYGGDNFGLQLIRVDDVVKTLQELAKEEQAKRKGLVIGITGSAGKSTTKEYLATLLGKKFKVAKTPGNSNSQVGFPIAILNGAGDEEVLVAEMGMTEKGQIAKLVQVAPPDIAVVTKVGVAHIGYFPDGQEGIAEAKAEIFSHPKTKLRIANIQAMKFEAMKKWECVTFGGEGADFILEKGWEIRELGVPTRQFSLPFEESHFCENFLAAATVARCMGLEWEEIFELVPNLKSLPLRFEKIKRNGVLFINDCYNAQLDSIEAALANLPKPEVGGKTLVVFGEITDLGQLSEKMHRNVAEMMLKAADHMLCYGKGCLPMLDVFSHAQRPVEFFKEMSELKGSMFDLAKPGDVVLIKGSRFNQLWKLLED